MNTSCWCCPQCLESKWSKVIDHGDGFDVFGAPEKNSNSGTNDVEPSESYCLQHQHPMLHGNCCDLADDVEDTLPDYDESHSIYHVLRVLEYHPRYLRSFHETYQYLMHIPGPLSREYCFFIGIMAAGRHQCSYLINALTTDFLDFGGDPTWLNGLDHVPQKLQDLYEVNKLLAHRPWLLSVKHIEKLAKGGQNNWSMSELAPAITILVFFHSLSSFVYSCGISIDDLDRGSVSSINSIIESVSVDGLHKSSSSSETCGIEFLLEQMKLVNEDALDYVTPEERMKRFEQVESQSVDLLGTSKQRSPKEDVLRYTEDLNFTYEDFATQMMQQPGLEPFPVKDYSWEDQGYSLASTLYVEIGQLLDDKFHLTQGLTYNTIGNTRDVDTSSFRRAVWNYTQCMFGLRHDDYDYNEINSLLEKNLRSYIKTITCFPETVTHSAYRSFLKDFLDSEKVHVNIMIQEARLQAELLYGLRAISEFRS